jgi:hypothetical protein
MTAWEFLRDFRDKKNQSIFQSREGSCYGPASNSELKRWCSGALRINGEQVVWNEELDFPIISVVLFPKKNTITLY